MNTKSILVAYASKYGSTEEVAETIGQVMSETGFQVDLQPVADVKSLEAYDAVVLGAAIYSTHWHPDAHAFLSKNQEILRTPTPGYFHARTAQRRHLSHAGVASPAGQRTVEIFLAETSSFGAVCREI